MKIKFLIWFLSFACIGYVGSIFSAAAAKEAKESKEDVEAQMQYLKKTCISSINSLLEDIKKRSDFRDFMSGIPDNFQEQLKEQLRFFQRNAIKLYAKAQEHGINFEREGEVFVKAVFMDAFLKIRKLMNDIDPQKLINESDREEFTRNTAGVECKIQ